MLNSRHRFAIGLRLSLTAIVSLVLLGACVRQGPPAPLDNRGNMFFGRGTAIPVARPAVERPQPTRATPVAIPMLSTPGVATVQTGDTLFEVSRRHNVPIRAIIAANNLTPPYTLTPGRQLILPQQSYHRVAAGDTVATIARTYGVSTHDLLRSNGIEPPFLIYIGQPLMIPVPTPAGPQPAMTTAATPPSFPPPPTTTVQRPGADSLPGQGSRPPDVAAQPEILAAIPPPSAALEPAIGAAPGSFIWPVQGKVLSGFGPKPGGLVNDGINIAAPSGAAVRASQDGTIAYAGNELRGYGNLLLVRHDNGWVTAYAHNSDLLAAKGDRVKRGQVIARVGRSGNVTEPQLHFEMRQGTRTVDPTRYLSGQGVSG